MSNIVLANIDYQTHMTNEGDQFQRGLEGAGWILCGAGYGDGCRDVRELIDRHAPKAVVVHDRRDWDPSHDGSFRKDIGFKNLEYLKSRDDIYKCCVVKDAGSCIEYHEKFCEDVGANAVIVYYHQESILKLSPWLDRYKIIRTYHSIDNDAIKTLQFNQSRARGIVTGAVSGVYPMRSLAFRVASSLGIEGRRHPGYHNKGCCTNDYLKMLTKYKVHVATSSRYGFALRKIIESVACGCTPVTDLPEYDDLPGIDGALVRVRQGAGLTELDEAIRNADENWDFDERVYWSGMAMQHYDYRYLGQELSSMIIGQLN